MILFTISGKKVALPTDFSFEYVVENRLFADADGYSLEIKLPLAGCPQNLDIFGFLNRNDVDIPTVRMPATLSSDSIALRGSIAIIGITEESVSVQFLQGRSVQNFEEAFEKVYINEIKGLPSLLVDVTPGNLVNPLFGEYSPGAIGVPFPWVIADSGEIVHNNAGKNSYNAYRWNADTKRVCRMPWLRTVLEKVTESQGYTHDFDAIGNLNLILCHAAPATLGSVTMADVLPHWTINELFENIEPLLCGEFDIDHDKKHIKFSRTVDLQELAGVTTIKDVVDSFEVSVSSENRQAGSFMKNLYFPDNGSRTWGLDSCDWFIKERLKNPNSSVGWVMPGTTPTVGSGGHRYYPPEVIRYDSIVTYNTITQLLNDFKDYEWFGASRNDIIEHNIYYVKQNRQYYAFRSKGCEERPNKGWQYHYELYPLNQFGGYIINTENNAEEETLKFTPVGIDMAEYRVAFIPYRSQDNSESQSAEDILSDDTDALQVFKVQQPAVINQVTRGNLEGNKQSAYDKLYVGYWPGIDNFPLQEGLFPITSEVLICDGWTSRSYPFCSLRVNYGYTRGADSFKTIDARKMYKFSFLSDTIPNPRSIFVIAGKRYLCSKISTSFDSHGLSRLMKGEFYRF